MSTGSAAIPLLKAAPEADQVADRLSGGRWRGLELCLAPRHVASAEALDAAIAVGRGVKDAGHDLTAECPVAWPSGAFVRVDRLDDEARRGIEASARFAAGIGAPVLTIHLFVPIVLGLIALSFVRLAQRNIAAHRALMQRVYFGACVLAGLFTLTPDRLIVVRNGTTTDEFGPEASQVDVLASAAGGQAAVPEDPDSTTTDTEVSA